MKTISPPHLVSNKESLFLSGYFIIYLAYLFNINLESDLLHWISLVILPLGGTYLIRKASRSENSFKEFLNTVGISRTNAGTWMKQAIMLGIGLSILQLVISRNADAFIELIKTGKIFINAPIALIFLLFTTGLTEEVFFRGLVQPRLHKLTGSPWMAIILSTIIFGIYHIPYAYLNPHWPSAGNLSHAIRLAMVDGSIGGLVLGFVFLRSRYNLFAAIVVHTLIDLFPAMTMIKFGGQ